MIEEYQDTLLLLEIITQVPLTAVLIFFVVNWFRREETNDKIQTKLLQHSVELQKQESQLVIRNQMIADRMANILIISQKNQYAFTKSLMLLEGQIKACRIRLQDVSDRLRVIEVIISKK